MPHVERVTFDLQCRQFSFIAINLMQPKSFTLSKITLALSLAFTYPTFASNSQTDAAADSDVTERISITANRKENLDTDLPMSVETVSSEELALDNGQHVAESLNSLAGVLVNQLQGAQGHNASIRMPINYSGYYLYLQDNVPLQSPAFFNHNALWWSSFNSSVGRVEVLKGAGTALYGSGAVAATVNVISKSNSDKPQSRLEYDGGEHDYHKLAFSHSQSINNSQSLGVSVSQVTNKGWRDNTDTRRSAINARHQWQYNEDLAVTSSLVASKLNQQMATNLSATQFELDASDSGLPPQVLAIDPRRISDYVRLSTQIVYDYADDSYLSIIPYLRYRSNDYNAVWSANMAKVESSVNSAGLLLSAGFAHQDGSETAIGFDVEHSTGKQYSFQQVTVQTTGWGADTFLAGEEYYDDTSVYLGLSPYLQHRRPLSEALDLTVGLRFDRASYEFDNHLGVIGDIGHGAQSIADRKDTFNHLSPKASLNYQLGAHSSVYLRFANSFRLPTASSLYHIKNNDSNELISTIQPEVSDTYELGYKANFANWSLDVALYRMDVDDAIVNAWDDYGIRFKSNAGSAKHQGFEAALDWQLSHNASVSVSYAKSSHQYGRYIVDEGRVGNDGQSRAQDLSGNDMQLAPDYIANVRFRYQPKWLEGLTSMLELQSIGDYWMDDANTKRYSGYTVANVKFNYQWDEQLSLNARVVNLTDKFYAQQVDIAWGRERYAPGNPRHIYVGLNYQW